MIHKRRLLILFLMFALIIFSGCQQSQNDRLGFDKQEEQNYAEAVKVVNKFFSSAMKGNYDAAFNLIDAEALSYYTDDTKMDKGLSNIRVSM